MIQDTSDTLDNTTPLQDDTAGSGMPGGDDSHTAEVNQLQKETEQLREQLARSQADYNNYVRRSREEQGQIGEWAENKALLKFLTVLDNMERAVEHTPEEFKSQSWTEGIFSIIRGMQKTIEDFGVTRMNPIGQEINPDLHEVVSQIPHASTDIQKEIETGYMRSGKALRHAKVIVGDGNLV